MKTALSLLCCLVAVSTFPADYYIDYDTGNDANAGTSTGSPWKHHPDMAGWTGGSHTTAAGNNYYFKGGVTWPNAALSLYISANGTETNRIYIGVDQTWYSGDQYVVWTNGWGNLVTNFNWPVFDAEGTDIVDARNFGGGSSGTRNNAICIDGDYVTIDNIHVKGIFINDSGASPNPDAGNDHTIRTYDCAGTVITNCYLSDWVVGTAYGGDVGGAYASVTTNSVIVSSRIWGPIVTDTNYNAGGPDFGTGINGFWEARDCDLQRLVQGVWSARWVSNCIVYNGTGSSDSAVHENAINMYGQKVTVNSAVVDWASGETIFLVPGWGTGDYECIAANNIVINSAGIKVKDSSAADAETLAARIYNNTIWRTNSASGIQLSTTQYVDVIDIRNNLFITDDGAPDIVGGTPDGTVTYTEANNYVITSAQAAAAGMSVANLLKNSSAISSVTDAGADLSAWVGTDKEGVARPQSGTFDIGAYEYIPGISGNTPNASGTDAAAAGILGL